MTITISLMCFGTYALELMCIGLSATLEDSSTSSDAVDAIFRRCIRGFDGILITIWFLVC